MSIIQSLSDLEQFLAGECRAFTDSAKLCEDRGMSKSLYYCLGVSAAYENVLGRLRGIVPDSLLKDVANG